MIPTETSPLSLFLIYHALQTVYKEDPQALSELFHQCRKAFPTPLTSPLLKKCALIDAKGRVDETTRVVTLYFLEKPEKRPLFLHPFKSRL